MKKFLIKILLFVTIVFFIALARFFVLSDENKTYAILSQKLDYVEKHPEYNMLFIGSSKINNQVDTPYIDSCFSDIKPYNLGANASFNLEMFQTLNKILDNPEIKPEYIVFELQEKINLTQKNLHAPRSFRVFDFENVKFTTQYQWEDRNYYQLALVSYSFLLNIFSFHQEGNTENKNEFITSYDGFSPLDLTHDLSSRMDLKEMQKDIVYRLNYYKNDSTKYTANKVLYDKINEYASIFEKRGIHFLIIVPGPAEKDAKKLEVYYPYLKAPIINLIDIQQYPEFYQLENRWDYGHLNQKGSRIFSEKLKNELKKHIK